MRHFTKTHNDLKWLFPVAQTKKEAEQKFEDVEDQAKYLAHMAGVEEKDKDLAIDCFMKGYSQALHLESDNIIDKYVGNIYKNLLKLKKNYLDDEKEIADLRGILNSSRKLKNLIIKELKEVQK